MNGLNESNGVSIECMRVENVRDLQAKCYKFLSIFSAIHKNFIQKWKNYVVYSIRS